MADILHERLELSLFRVETASYAALNIVDVVYPHWIVSHVLEGDVETRTRGERWRVRSGDVMVHPPNLPFTECAQDAGTHQWLLCEVAVAAHIDLFRLYPVAPVVTLIDAGEYARVFEVLQTSWGQPIVHWRNLYISACVAQLCSMVLEGWQQSGGKARSQVLETPQDRFIEVVKYMSEHLGEKMTRDELAALVHLHPGYFDRAFHAVYGCSPMQMLRDLRLRRALELLESTDAPLPAIAMSCGLGEAGYFSRVFRQRYGQTPGQYRASTKSTRQSYILPL